MAGRFTRFDQPRIARRAHPHLFQSQMRVGYVEAVATAEAHRRKGYGTIVMKRLNELIRARYQLGVLSTGAHSFYESLPIMDVSGEIVCDWRVGDAW